MGLDSYLYAHTFVSSLYGKEGEAEVFNSIKELMQASPFIEEDQLYFAEAKIQVGYWRKFNALHHYIIKNITNGVDNCNPIEFTRHEITKLVSVLEEVNEDNAAELFPTTSGFFFGSTDYDEYYFTQVNNAKQFISNLLENSPKNWTFTYQASW